MSVERCIFCGVEIPEGIQVCPDCERKVMLVNEHRKNFNDVNRGIDCPSEYLERCEEQWEKNGALEKKRKDYLTSFRNWTQKVRDTLRSVLG